MFGTVFRGSLTRLHVSLRALDTGLAHAPTEGCPERKDS